VAYGVAHIDAVQAQQRQARGEGARRMAVGLHEDLVQLGAFFEPRVGPVPPVVEVAGNHHRGVRRDVLAHQVAEHVHLLLAMRLHQAQVHADGVDVDAAAGNLQFAVQQAAALGAADGHVAVFKTHDGKLGQHRVAMVAVGVDGVAAIGELRPDGVGQEFVVRRFGVVVELVGVLGVGARDFLQEHHVGAHAAHGFAQFGQDELAVEEGKALVDVDREHLEGERGLRAYGRQRGLGVCLHRGHVDLRACFGRRDGYGDGQRVGRTGARGTGRT
jgi:hypothetical protein